MINIITNLRRERENREWTLEKLGKQIGLTRDAVSKLERKEREPSRKTLIKLEQLFNKPHTYLFAEAGKE